MSDPDHFDDDVSTSLHFVLCIWNPTRLTHERNPPKLVKFNQPNEHFSSFYVIDSKRNIGRVSRTSFCIQQLTANVLAEK